MSEEIARDMEKLLQRMPEDLNTIIDHSDKGPERVAADTAHGLQREIGDVLKRADLVRSRNPRGEFLEARGRYVAWLLYEQGESVEQIQAAMAMDPGQVRLVAASFSERLPATEQGR